MLRILLITTIAMILASSATAQTSVPNNANTIASTSDPVAPDFTLKDLQGQTHHLSEYHGKTIVLAFWATWCVTCQTEIPFLSRMQDRYKKDGLVVVGISMDYELKTVRVAQIARKRGANYLLLKGTPAIGRLYGNIDYLPTTFFIDRSGKLVDRTFGDTSDTDTEALIQKLLGR